MTNAGKALFSKNRPIILKMAVFATGHKNTFLSFAHARYDSGVQHEIDVFSNRISIINPGSFANDFRPEDFVNGDLHSFLRNEQISKTLYLCKDVETFGSGLRKIYSLCDFANVKVSYTDSETDFTIEFSRIDRNNMPDDGIINDVINGTLTEFETEIFRLLKNNKNLTVSEIVDICGKSVRTVNRAIASLKSKKLIERIGSNKTGYWKTN
jgi:ATP-dependent DNA helicase RecG